MLPSLHSRELRAQLTRFPSKGSCPLRSFVGGVNGTELDVAEGDSSVGLLGLDIAGLARGGGTSTASSTDLVGSNGVGRVEPEHVGGVVIPDREDESHASIEVLTEGSKTTLLGELVGVTGDLLLFLAELVGDLVGLCDSRDVGVGLLDDLAVLDVDTANGCEGTGGGIVVRQKLCHNCDLRLRVNSLARSEKVGCTESVGVEIASILVAVAVVAGLARTASSVASARAVGGASMRSKSSGDGVLW